MINNMLKILVYQAANTVKGKCFPKNVASQLNIVSFVIQPDDRGHS